MFTWSVRVGCSFQARVSEISNMFDISMTIPTLVTDPNSIHLATGLSVNLTACWLYFLPCHLMKQACLYQVSGLSQIWSSRLYVMTNRLCRRNNHTVGKFSRPVCKCSRLAWKTFHVWVPESGIFVTNKP